MMCRTVKPLYSVSRSCAYIQISNFPIWFLVVLVAILYRSFQFSKWLAHRLFISLRLNLSVMLFLFLFFQGIPGHVLLPILENLDPLEIEKVEGSSIFKAMSMLEKSILLIELYTFKVLCVTDQLHESALWCINLFNIFLSISFQKLIERNWH